MKILIVSAALLLAPALVLAQTDAPAAAAAAKSAAATGTAPKTKKAATKKSKPSVSRTEIKSQANAVAAGAVAAEAALSPEELAAADRVHTGKMPCELGAFVTVTKDAKLPGYFDIEGKGFKYRMQSVVTKTGAVRLEDANAGAVWLQVATKSMLMNQKLGQRLADECQSPEQLAFAENYKKNPTGAGVLDKAPVPVPASPAAAALPATTATAASPTAPALPAAPASTAAPAQP